nr:hypothetical protein CFP56_79047 [Quercus suber]
MENYPGPLQAGALSMAHDGSALTEYQAHHSDADNAYDSDASWTSKDEAGSFALEIRQELQNFLHAVNQRQLITREFSRHERRVVHSIAHDMGLKHSTIPSGRRHCQMCILKSSSVQQGLTGDASLASPIDIPTSSADFLPPFDDPNGYHHYYANTPDLVYPAEVPAGATTAGTSTDTTEAPPATTPKTPTTTQKSKRGPKQPGAFPCGSCHRVFDCASARTKHLPVHEPHLKKYHCELCKSHFRYAKDLRRHEDTQGHRYACELATRKATGAVGTAADDDDATPASRAVTAGTSRPAGAVDVPNSQTASPTSPSFDSTPTSPDMLFDTQSAEMDLWVDPFGLNLGRSTVSHQHAAPLGEHARSERTSAAADPDAGCEQDADFW